MTARTMHRLLRGLSVIGGFGLFVATFPPGTVAETARYAVGLGGAALVLLSVVTRRVLGPVGEHPCDWLDPSS